MNTQPRTWSEHPDYFAPETEPDLTDPDSFHLESSNFSNDLLTIGGDILHLIALGDEKALAEKTRESQRGVWSHFRNIQSEAAA